MDNYGQPTNPVSSASPPTDASQLSEPNLSKDRGPTVSDDERISYYFGIVPKGEYPILLYRTGSAKYPWVQPTGRFFVELPTKSLRGVYGTPLNVVWNTVGPQIRDLVKSLELPSYSIDTARFVTYAEVEDREGTLGPVVIWIAVHPGSTTADTAHEISQNILRLLEKNGVKEVEVEWYEAVSWKAASATAGPALLPVVYSQNHTVHVRRHLTAALGIPIATAEREAEDVQGSVGFFFHEGLDEHDNPSTKVFGVSCRHVLRKEIQGKYDFKGTDGAPRQYVRVNGHRRFQRGIDELKAVIEGRGVQADLYMEEVVELEARNLTINNKEEAIQQGGESLLEVRELLDKERKAIAQLEIFRKDIEAQWSNIELRNIGHVDYCPPISVSDVEGERYTEDWGAFELEESKFKAQFKGNVVDLGTTISPGKLTRMICPQMGTARSFRYPSSRQMRIQDIITQEILADHDLFDRDDHDQPCLVVLKDGCGTDLTVGYYAGLESFRRTEDGNESVELAFYNYGKYESFSAKGDSGSLIFDGLGRMVGLLHSCKSKAGSETSAFVTYATPAWWLIGRIKEKYPNADFFRTAW